MLEDTNSLDAAQIVHLMHVYNGKDNNCLVDKCTHIYNKSSNNNNNFISRG